ncbi:ATP-binding protein [Pseudomonas protegens]|uniref:ATP-binding protein n=1 Tax=Pseudomonas protegens TaxID=380021 RepID=UPI00383AEF9C
MDFFDSHKRCCYALGVVIAVGAAVALGNYYRVQVEDVYRASVQMQTQDQAQDLEQWKSNGFAIGALSILGRHNPWLKRIVLEPEPSAELMERATMPLKTLSLVVDANHAFVLNRDGVVVAAYDQQGQTPLGLNVAFRPYFKVALNGGSSVYGAISATTGTRMFYMAVPIFESRTRQDKVIGVLVARFDADRLDASLSKPYSDDLQMILSPSGVVLAASSPDLVLKSDRAWPWNRFTGEIRRQFSDYRFANGVPERLPFDAHQSVIQLDGRRYSLSRVDFDWNDPSGPWTLITLGDLDTLLPGEQVLLIEGLSALVFLLLLWGGLRRLADARRHKRDVAQIEQSEQRLDMALQSGALGLWDWNLSLGTVINNDVWLQILGYSKQQMEQAFGHGLERWTALVHPDDYEPVMARLKAHLNDEVGEYRAEYRMRNKEGQWLWVLDIGKIMQRDANGAPTRVTGVLQDISERKAVEAQIQQSRRDAERATQAKSEFLDCMSHEIRTPLNAIIGMAHLALDLPLEPVQRDYIEKIDRAAKHLVGTINGVLDLSKIEAGKLSMEQVGFDLRELVDDVLLLVRQRAEEKALRLQLDIPASLPRRYVGDPLRLAQVLTNLVDNSIKFTEAGHVCIGVCLVRQWDHQVLLCFSVTDTGVGISDEQQARLFNAFVQADRSISRRYGGSGLGLTISKKIVQLMQGDIWVKSRPGQGATFKFSVQLSLSPLPLEENCTAPAASCIAPAGPSTGAAAGQGAINDPVRWLAGTRVLVVEDNRLNQEVLQGLLQRVGVQVVLAANGAEALHLLLEEGRFDAVLMDCQMPVMDGFDTTRKIRGYRHLQSLPIIAVTASSQPDVQGRALAAGMSDLLSKPLEVAAFYRALVRWIKATDMPVAQAPAPPGTSVLTSTYEGIDTAQGLAVVNQDLALHRKLLADFRDSQQQVIERLWQAHATGDLAVIGFLAHSLRGNAGSIGATAVKEAAGQLEEQADGPAELEPLIEQLARCLEPVLAGLASLPAADGDQAPQPRELDAEQVSALERLAKLLHSHNAQALALIDELYEQYPCGPLRAIQERIYRLEFQQALDLLVDFRD